MTSRSSRFLFIARIATPFLILGLGSPPSSAYALRPVNAGLEDSPVRDALNAKLSAGLEREEEDEEEAEQPLVADFSPAAGLEGGGPNLNFSPARAVKRHLAQLPALRLLSPKARGQLAALIVARRPSSGYKDKKDFVRRLKNQSQRLGVTEDQVRSIANSGRFGMSRRTFLGWATLAVGGSAASAYAGQALYRWLFPRNGRAIWILGPHGTPRDFERVVRELRLAEGDPQVIYVGEVGPPALMELRRTHPEVAGQLTPELLDGLIARLRSVQGDADMFKMEALPLAQGLVNKWEQNNGTNAEFLRRVRENPTGLRIPTVREATGAALPIMDYLARNRAVQAMFEEPPFETFLLLLRSDLAYEESIRALFLHGDREAYFRAFAEWYRFHGWLNDRRDAAFSKQIRALLRDNPGATVIVSRGSYHVDVAEWVGDYEGLGFEAEVRGREIGTPDPYYAALASYREALLVDEAFLIPEEASVRRAVLRNYPWAMLFNVLQALARGRKTSQELWTQATSVIDALSDEEVEELLSAVQKYGRLAHQVRGKDFQPWLTDIRLYLASWLQANGKLNPYVDRETREALKEFTLERMEEYIREIKHRIHDGQRAGLEGYSEFLQSAAELSEPVPGPGETGSAAGLEGGDHPRRGDGDSIGWFGDGWAVCQGNGAIRRRAGGGGCSNVW